MVARYSKSVRRWTKSTYERDASAAMAGANPVKSATSAHTPNGRFTLFQLPTALSDGVFVEHTRAQGDLLRNRFPLEDFQSHLDCFRAAGWILKRRIKDALMHIRYSFLGQGINAHEFNFFFTTGGFGGQVRPVRAGIIVRIHTIDV